MKLLAVFATAALAQEYGTRLVNDMKPKVDSTLGTLSGIILVDRSEHNF